MTRMGSSHPTCCMCSTIVFLRSILWHFGSSWSHYSVPASSPPISTDIEIRAIIIVAITINFTTRGWVMIIWNDIFRCPTCSGALLAFTMFSRIRGGAISFFLALVGSLSSLIMSSVNFFWILKIFENLFKFSWIFWNHLESLGRPRTWEVGILLNPYESFWILLNPLEPFWILWNPLESF